MRSPTLHNAIVAGRLAAIAIVLLAVPGCRETRTTVAGTVTVDGQPLTLASDARGTVVFHPVSGQGTMLTSLLDASGHFRLATGASSQIEPGKYQVAVSVVELLPKADEAEQGAKLITPVKYASANDSGLEANVVPGENQLRFNLASENEAQSLDAGASKNDADEKSNPTSQEAAQEN